MFQNYLNKQHKNITFTSEIEENGSLSFPNITITSENNKLETLVYWKPTFSSVFTNFESFIPEIRKPCFIEVLDYAPVTKTFIGKLNFKANIQAQ